MRDYRKIALTVACVLAFGWVMAQAQSTVTINQNNRYQTIDGFGAHGSMDVWWDAGPFYSTPFLNLIIDDLGMTIDRNEFYPDFEPTNVNSNPSSIDMSKFNYGGTFGTKQKAWVQAVQAKATASGEPFKFFTTYWTPPAWMKDNNSEINGGHLLVADQTALGVYAVATARAYKEQCGVDLYAISIQNEPSFSETYNSCVYTSESYRDAIKVVGPILHAAYPNVNLLGPEDMLANWSNGTSVTPGVSMQDSVARQHLNILAVHGYGDGVHPTPASAAANYWRTAARGCASVKKPLWMTETSGYDDTWSDTGSGAFQVGESIFGALKYGNVAAWVWWQLCSPSAPNVYELISAGNPTKRYYVSKQFYRYIRPGAVMIDGISNDSLVFSAAFQHTTNKTLTVVLLNCKSSTTTVTLSGTSLPSFTAYRTSATENCVNVGTVTTSIPLPATTITTLYGTNYNPPTAVLDPQTGRVNPVALAMHGSARVYSLDGKLVARLTDAQFDSGRLQWNGIDRNGMRAARGAYYAALTDLAGKTSANRLPVDMR